MKIPLCTLNNINLDFPPFHSFLIFFYFNGFPQSTTNSLWIKFVSDGSVQKAGFSASFMKVPFLRFIS